MEEKEVPATANKKLTIKDWAVEDKPREKMLSKGWQALSDAELIAILLGSGTGDMTAVDVAREIMKAANGSLEKLANFTMAEMQKVKGIGQARAITIGAALELSRRRNLEKKEEIAYIKSSADCYNIIRPHLHDESVENFFVILLAKNMKVIRIDRIGIGGISNVMADPKVIFKKAIEHNSSAIILVHNHPSGNKTPSEADKSLTLNILQIGKLFDIAIPDHLIYTNTGYYSFADEGLMEQLRNKTN